MEGENDVEGNTGEARVDSSTESGKEEGEVEEKDGKKKKRIGFHDKRVRLKILLYDVSVLKRGCSIKLSCIQSCILMYSVLVDSFCSL